MSRLRTHYSVIAFDMDGSLYPYTQGFISALRAAQGQLVSDLTDGQISPEQGTVMCEQSYYTYKNGYTLPALKLGLSPVFLHEQLHRVIPTETLEPVRASYRTERPIAWQRVHNLADFVYFDHHIHTAKGVGCVECHGRVDRMPLLYQEKTLLMEWCLECHRNPTPRLRPRGEVFSMTWAPPADIPDLGPRLAREYKVKGPDELTSCSVCHR